MPSTRASPFHRHILEPIHTRLAADLELDCLLTEDLERIVAFDPHVLVQSEGEPHLYRQRLPDFAALRAVHKRARADGLLSEAIDEAHLFARFGARIALVEGPDQNFKITVASDFERAQAMLHARPASRTASRSRAGASSA